MYGYPPNGNTVQGQPPVSSSDSTVIQGRLAYFTHDFLPRSCSFSNFHQKGLGHSLFNQHCSYQGFILVNRCSYLKITNFFQFCSFCHGSSWFLSFIAVLFLTIFLKLTTSARMSLGTSSQHSLQYSYSSSHFPDLFSFNSILWKLSLFPLSLISGFPKHGIASVVLLNSKVFEQLIYYYLDWMTLVTLRILLGTFMWLRFWNTQVHWRIHDTGSWYLITHCYVINLCFC